MLRIDQIPLTEYLAIVTALSMTIRDADADGAKCREKGWASAVEWERVAREAREAKALMEAHRFPNLAALVAAEGVLS